MDFLAGLLGFLSTYSAGLGAAALMGHVWSSSTW